MASVGDLLAEQAFASQAYEALNSVARARGLGATVDSYAADDVSGGFVCTLKLGESMTSTGSGRSKKAARSAAALSMLVTLLHPGGAPASPAAAAPAPAAASAAPVAAAPAPTAAAAAAADAGVGSGAAERNAEMSAAVSRSRFVVGAPAHLRGYLENEELQMIHVESNAWALARAHHAQLSAGAASGSSGSSSTAIAGNVLKAVYAHSPNFLACAFRWAAAFTAELRRLQQASSATASAAAATAYAASAAAGPAPAPALLDRVSVRVAGAGDVGILLGFIRELAEYEREPEAVLTDEAQLLREGFGPGRQYCALVAEVPAAVWQAHLAATGQAASAGAGAAVAETAEDAEASPGSARKRRRTGSLDGSSSTSTSTSGGSGGSGGSSGMVPVAMAIGHSAYSTWEGRVLYLEDVYITPAARRHGLGQLMFSVVARAAAAARCARMQWSALKWNTPAINLYKGPALAATELSEWTLFRLTRPDIARVAGVALGFTGV